MDVLSIIFAQQPVFLNTLVPMLLLGLTGILVVIVARVIKARFGVLGVVFAMAIVTVAGLLYVVWVAYQIMRSI